MTSLRALTRTLLASAVAASVATGYLSLPGTPPEGAARGALGRKPASELVQHSCRRKVAALLTRAVKSDEREFHIWDLKLDSSVGSLLPNRLEKFEDVPFSKRVARLDSVVKITRKRVFRKRRASSVLPQSLKEAVEEGQLYTYSIVREKSGAFRFSFGKAGTTLQDLLAKHAILAGPQADVRLAGEFWVRDGAIYFTNASGTFMPGEELLAKARPIFQGFGYDDVVPMRMQDAAAHPSRPPSPVAL
jgi:hypothetical protein